MDKTQIAYGICNNINRVRAGTQLLRQQFGFGRPHLTGIIKDNTPAVISKRHRSPPLPARFSAHAGFRPPMAAGYRGPGHSFKSLNAT